MSSLLVFCYAETCFLTQCFSSRCPLCLRFIPWAAGSWPARPSSTNPCSFLPSENSTILSVWFGKLHEANKEQITGYSSGHVWFLLTLCIQQSSWELHSECWASSTPWPYRHNQRLHRSCYFQHISTPLTLWRMCGSVHDLQTWPGHRVRNVSVCILERCEHHSDLVSKKKVEENKG